MTTRGRDLPPRDYVISGSWPHGQVTDHAAGVAQEVARRLAVSMGERELSANRLSKAAGVNRQTVANVLAGAVWADLKTVSLLEKGVGAPLWPVFGSIVDG
jgi:hypothetical protein